jgi:hypothetical protein
MRPVLGDCHGYPAKMFPDSDIWRSSYSPYEVAAAAAFDEIRISTKAAIISSTTWCCSTWRGCRHAELNQQHDGLWQASLGFPEGLQMQGGRQMGTLMEGESDDRT